MNENPEKVEKVSNIDQYQLIERQKRQLFNDLITSTELKQEDRDILLSRVFEHSLEDGMDLSEQWVSDKSVIIESVMRDEFIEKHPTFALRLSNKLQEYRGYVSSENKEVMQEFADTMAEKVSDTELDESAPTTKNTIEASSTIQAFLERIDEYYLNFLRLRKIKEQGPEDKSESEGERLAEQTMIADLRILEPHYYSDAIRGIVGDKVEVPGGLLDQQTVEQLLKKAKLSLDEEEVEKALKKARYKVLDVIYNVSHDESERLLKRELVDHLYARGYSDEDFEVVKSEKTGRYEVIDKKGKNYELKAENLRLIEEIPRLFLMTPEDSYYDQIRKKTVSIDFKRINKGENFWLYNSPELIDGEIYQKISAQSGHGFIIFPDGKRSEVALGYQELRKTDHAFYYKIAGRDLGQREFFPIYKNGKKIYDGDDWNANTEKIFEEKDGSVYWVGSQFDYDSQVGRNAIFKDKQLLRVFSWGKESISNLKIIDGRITYLESHYYNGSNLFYGEEKFGPYKSIKLLDNNEKLIFAATRKDGTSFIYEDDVEKELQIEGDIEEIIETKNGIYVLTQESRDNNPGGLPPQRIFDSKGNMVIKSNEIYSFGVNDGKLTYLYSTFEAIEGVIKSRWFFVFGDEKKEIKPLDRVPVVIGMLGDDLIYRRDNTFGTFKLGDIDITALREENIEVMSIKDIQISESRMVVIFDVTYKKEEGSEESQKRAYKVYEYTPEFTLTPQERKKLELLNILRSHSPQQIREYFEREYPDESKKSIKQKIKDALEHSKNVAQNLSQLISESPGLFLDSLSAKTDDLSDRNIDEFISTIFPEVQTNHWRAIRKARSERSYYSSSVSAYLNNQRKSDEFLDGDPRAAGQLEILTLRQPVTEFISSGIYGSLKKGESSWKKVPFQISESHIGPTREVTAEIKVEKGMKNIVIPKCLNASIIPERVKGVQEDGTEIDIEISKNSLGEVSIEVPEGIVTVLYSQAIQELPVVPQDIDSEQYEHFRKDIEKRFGNETVDSIAKLPEELQIFIESLEGLEPIEKVEAIESFVRTIGYYDFDNADVQSLKRYKSTEEVIAVMAQRMKELKRLPETPDKEKLEYKKFAGVCSDFAKLTTALLREAGIVSGMISGFQTDGTEMVVTEKNAHAISYALFPAENGKVKIIEIDGTPHGLNEADEKTLARIRQLSLKERMKKFEEGKDKVQEDYAKRMKELEDLVSKLDDETIKRLQNGQLEQFLNTILSGVKESHVAVIDSILNASRYAGFDVHKILNSGDVENQIKFIQFIEFEIKRERSKEKKEDYFKGEKLFKIIEEFVVRYARDEGVSNKGNALKIIERVLDLNKKYLDPLEYRSAIAIVTYLKATKMS